jgi:glycine/D-amino acid oxidase-like deaminating enzyme/nitrite reductase/ring-hydroxylating ferredoxin subunit
MEHVSYWHQTQKPRDYPRLDKDLKTDVLIVGGGITGITTAYCLTQRGIKPVVIEAETLCSGTTGNTTGKLTIQHDIIYSNLMEKYGIDAAKEFAKSQSKALRFVAQTVQKYGMDCQMEPSTAFIYAASANNEKDMLLNEYEAAKRLEIPAEWIAKPTFPKGSKALLGFSGQAVFHPVRYVQGLANAAVAGGATIYTNTKAIGVEDGDIKTVVLENGTSIRCRHLVQATQYPLYDGPNVFFTRLYAQRDYGIAAETNGNWPDGSYINIGEPTRSIRTHVENGKKILIVVGESHFPGRDEEETGDHYQNLIDFADQIAGVKHVLAKWSAQDYETPDQIPYIGRLSDESNIYVATGYRKWGLTCGTLAGLMIADLIDTGNCEYEDLYSRSRSDTLKSFKKVTSEVFAGVGELIKSKLEGTKDYKKLEKGEGRPIRFQGRKAGAFRDDNDRVTVLDISCTHLSTELNFNASEKTWDCPAHGGRFKTDGKLLEGPPKNPLPVLFEGSFAEFLDAVEGEKINGRGDPKADEPPVDAGKRGEEALNDMTAGPVNYHYPQNASKGTRGDRLS